MGIISPVAIDASGNPIATGSEQMLGKDEFLQLLVTQLQYQDPLEPMSDTEYIAQLAQFSSLEQMQNIADGLEVSNEWDYLQMQSLNNVLSTNLIGTDVKATYDEIYIDSESTPKISYQLDSYAETVQITVKDYDGNTVATLTEENIDEGQHTLSWDGRDSYGNRVPEGNYTLEISATNMSGNEIDASLTLIGKVESIVYRDGAAYLTVGGTEIPLGEVEVISEPGSLTGDTGDTDDSDSSGDGDL